MEEEYFSRIFTGMRINRIKPKPFRDRSHNIGLPVNEEQLITCIVNSEIRTTCSCLKDDPIASTECHVGQASRMAALNAAGNRLNCVDSED